MGLVGGASSSIFIAILCLNFLLISCDIRVVDRRTNNIVFQTASDFVRTGCGSLLENSFLIIADPADACDIPEEPPTKNILSSVFHSVFNYDGTNQWTLLVPESGECDLKTKFRNAASAGYSAIIVGTDERHEEITKPGVFSDDDEEFIDAHLVHPLDIEVLSKRFAGAYKQVMLEPPRLTRCKEEYQRTWLRARYISTMLRAWKRAMEILWECAKWFLHVLGNVSKGVLSPSLFHNHTRWTFSSVALSLATIFISLTAMMMVSMHISAKKLLKLRAYQEERRASIRASAKEEFQFEPKSEHKRDPKPSTPTPEEFQSQPKFEQKCDSKPSKPEEPSRSTNPPPTSQSQSTPRPRRIRIDKTLYHKINLGIAMNAKLTIAKVKQAYREMALRYHPDKNSHLDDKDLARTTEEFKRKTKSKDILLNYCKE